MHRLIVAILAAVDAAIAVAVGVAATLAPLTLLWVFAFGDAADWGSLWPASATIWQFGNLVPLDVTIPADYLAVAGIDPDAASFTLSLAPLAFAAFTAIFAARSGMRASQADAWVTGVGTGSVLFAGLAALVALTCANDVAGVELWQAILFPTLLFAVPALVAALVTEWCEAGAGPIAQLRDRVEAAAHGWGAVPGLVMRGSGVVLAGLIGLGALLTGVALILRGGEVIALYEAAHLDALGASIVTLAQLAYLPTVAVWSLSFIAGPGFALGEGTAVSPAGTQVGVVPGIPILGIIPDSTTPWLLLLALGPVAVGAFAGWIARSRLPASSAPRVPVPVDVLDAPSASSTAPASAEPDAAADPFRTAALDGLLAETAAARAPDPVRGPVPPAVADLAPAESEPIGARFVIAVGIAGLSAAGAALLTVFASGSAGPGALAEMGPAPGPVALAVGLEVILGAGILLLSPRARRRTPSTKAAVSAPPQATDVDGTPSAIAGEGGQVVNPDELDTGPIDTLPEEPAAPRVPFVFPTLPRVPGGASGGGEGTHDGGEGRGGAPVD